MSNGDEDSIIYTFNADNCIDAYRRFYSGGHSGGTGSPEEDSLWSNRSFVDNVLKGLVGDGAITDAICTGLAQHDEDTFETGLGLLASCRRWVEANGVTSLPYFIFQTMRDPLCRDASNPGYAHELRRLYSSLATLTLYSVSDKRLAVQLASSLLSGDMETYSRALMSIPVPSSSESGQSVE